MRSGLTSKLPTFQGLKSILRPVRKASGKTIESPMNGTSAGCTPKRNNTAAPSESGSSKKVDFTPSTKSRYAVKLAAASPSPSKLPHANAGRTSGPVSPYDPAAYTVHDDSVDEWEGAESEVGYPMLPNASSSVPSTPPVALINNNFVEKAKEHERRESKGFKSIFTTLEHPSRSTTPITLTNINAKTNGHGAEVILHLQNQPFLVTRSPGNGHSTKPSPSTIRRVRSSGVSNIIQPFEDTIKTVPHGLPEKKRRLESLKSDAEPENEPKDGKESRRFSFMPNVPGSWMDSTTFSENTDTDEGEKRGGKRARTEAMTTTNIRYGESQQKGGVKRTNKAREEAARKAKERKQAMPGQQKSISIRRTTVLEKLELDTEVKAHGVSAEAS